MNFYENEKCPEKVYQPSWGTLPSGSLEASCYPELFRFVAENLDKASTKEAADKVKLDEDDEDWQRSVTATTIKEPAVDGFIMKPEAGRHPSHPVVEWSWDAVFARVFPPAQPVPERIEAD